MAEFTSDSQETQSLRHVDTRVDGEPGKRIYNYRWYDPADFQFDRDDPLPRPAIEIKVLVDTYDAEERERLGIQLQHALTAMIRAVTKDETDG